MMTWEQKYDALAALSKWGTSICKDVNGLWYVSQSGVYISKPEAVVGVTGRARTINEAVEKTWEIYSKGIVAIQCSGEPKRYVRWNSFMWEDCEAAQ